MPFVLLGIEGSNFHKKSVTKFCFVEFLQGSMIVNRYKLMFDRILDTENKKNKRAMNRNMVYFFERHSN